MLLVFFRHGKAEPPRGVSDEERRLTSEGRRDVELVSRLLPAKPKVILSSPLKRAVETAEIIARTWRVGEVKITDRLRPDSPSGVDALRDLDVKDGYVLVGHNPWILETVEELVGGRLEVPAGSFAAVEVEELKPGGGILVALVNPQLARNLEGSGGQG